MENAFKIRLVERGDTARILEIYAYYVTNTIISFEYEPPSEAEFAERIQDATAEFPWLVCLQNEKIIGYAYAHKHRFRSAYQWSPESSVYIDPDFHTRGIGRILYETLFAVLRLQGYFNVYAGVGLPNEKSVGFHRALGFEEIGIFKKVGYKHGNWHDTHWFQLHLAPHITEPPAPKIIGEIKTHAAFEQLIAGANKRVAEKKQ